MKQSCSHDIPAACLWVLLSSSFFFSLKAVTKAVQLPQLVTVSYFPAWLCHQYLCLSPDVLYIINNSSNSKSLECTRLELSDTLCAWYRSIPSSLRIGICLRNLVPLSLSFKCEDAEAWRSWIPAWVTDVAIMCSFDSLPGEYSPAVPHCCLSHPLSNHQCEYHQ